MKHTMVYIKETINYGITYHYRASLQPVSFVNSNYTNGKNIQKLNDGYIFFVGKELVS